jgi:hypothetical protein
MVKSNLHGPLFKAHMAVGNGIFTGLTHTVSMYQKWSNRTSVFVALSTAGRRNQTDAPARSIPSPNLGQICIDTGAGGQRACPPMYTAGLHDSDPDVTRILAHALAMKR